eukprot:SAG31_NODE_84_length_27014_cov_3.743006_27_plen_36_part_01
MKRGLHGAIVVAPYSVFQGSSSENKIERQFLGKQNW